MLPTGHIAGGFLTGAALLQILKPDLPQTEMNQLLFWAMFWGFAPDLDEFWFFFKNRSLLVAPAGVKTNHHYYFSHAPVLWLAGGLLIYFFVSADFWKAFGLLVWLGSWSHFVLDSVENGIMWLWPFNNRLYGLKNRGEKFVIAEKNFFKHSFKFLELYSKRISFYLEILIILTALIIYLK